MKVLFLDTDAEGMGVDLASRSQDSGHDVRYWLPTERGEPMLYGQGMFDRPIEWEPSMDWAELIVMIGNSRYTSKLAPYFGKGYPIFGTNAKSAELELDRAKGQQVLTEHGVDTLPYQVVESSAEAVALIKETGLAYAMKPWGGDADKSMTYVSRSPADGIFTLEKWEREGKFKGQLMMQEKVDGVEVGIAGWFGPGGWGKYVEESFEHKKFLNDDLGENTGEMGTVIRHVAKSKLFDKVLKPITPYLEVCGYVGDCSVNCIIDAEGTPWPLEFTMRLGWPDFCIRQALIPGDPLEWIADLVNGRDSFRPRPDVALGLLLAHGDFPKSKDPPATWAGYPVYGVTPENEHRIHWQQAMDGRAPVMIGDEVTEASLTVSAGNYVCIVSGTGRTVMEAYDEAYSTAWELKMPSNLMFRTDIGKRLEKHLPLIQAHGYSLGMRFE